MTLFAIASVLSIVLWIYNPGSGHNFIHPGTIIAITLCIFLLYWFSIHGYSKLSAYILIAIFFGFAFLMGYTWGLEVTASLLIYTLVIVMSGILINTRFAFAITIVIAIVLIGLGHIQDVGIVIPDYQWRLDSWQLSDTIMTVIIFMIIATVSWLSNREIERTLIRAQHSEEALRIERDSLEVTVEERTRELKEAQLEKIRQLYSFAEFGRLSSGLFHDLMNPLTAVSLNVERAKSEGEASGGLSKAQDYLDQAFVAAQRMERFISAVHKQIVKKGECTTFCAVDEARQVIDILSYKALIARVELILDPCTTCEIAGDTVQWNQVMLNLISNGIDAYDDITHDDGIDRIVRITFTPCADTLICTIRDNGVGIDPCIIDQIFDPFFTTKRDQSTKGTGIGLSIVKQLVEKEFNGTISVQSTPYVGTTFTIVLPI